MTSTYTLVAFCSNFIRKRTSRFQEIAQVSCRITLIIYCTKVRHIPVYWTWNENILCSKKPCSFANSLYRTKAGLTRSNVIPIRCLPLRAPILRFHLGPGEHVPPVAVTSRSKRPLTVSTHSNNRFNRDLWGSRLGPFTNTPIQSPTCTNSIHFLFHFSSCSFHCRNVQE